jgi:hypothetical protein
MIPFKKKGFMMILQRRVKGIFLSFAFLISFFLAENSTAAFASPPCLDLNSNEVLARNEQVLKWKTSTPNQFLSRAHVTGVVENIYPDRNGHDHFQLRLGPHPKDTLELVYNQSFGEIGALVPGSSVEACGDYITSNAPTQIYEPSPDGAILHWIHRSTKPKRHPSGYLILNGTLYGQGSGH